jgi:spermidine synthase
VAFGIWDRAGIYRYISFFVAPVMFQKHFRKIYEHMNISGYKDTVCCKTVKGSDIALNLFLLGFISSSFQLLLLKELMNISGGYELIAGTFLGTWLIASASGSSLAAKSTLSDTGKINLIFVLSPLVTLALLFLLSRLCLNPGETPSFISSLILSLLILFPFCAASGFTFVKLVEAGKHKGFLPGKSFSIETAGGIVAGIVISILAAGILNSYQTLLLVILIGISYYFLKFRLNNHKLKFAYKIFILLISSLIIISSPDRIFRSILLHGLRVTSSEETPYGNVTIAEYNGEESIYYNQRLLKYNEDAVEREEDIHFAMLQSDNPENVLIISGAINSLIPEIKKYSTNRIVYVERDPELSRMQKTHLPDESENLIIENDDAFSYIRNTDIKFNVVILLLPPPSSFSLNRFYTLEFFTALKEIMQDNAVFSCSAGINPNYFNEESVKLFSSVFNSLAEVFRFVTPVAGTKLYFIASDKEIDISFGSLTSVRKIDNLYVNSDYFADDLVASRSAEIRDLMNENVRQNRAAVPVACYYYQAFNLSKNLNNTTLVLLIMLTFFAVPVFLITREGRIMYFTASALAGFEIIILLMLQLTIGNMYQLTGLIIASLMAGLAAGSGIRIRGFPDKEMFYKILILIGFYVFAGLTADKLLGLNTRLPVISLLTIATFIPAFITGSLFRDLTSRDISKAHVSNIYTADLAGSALGFILFSGLAVSLLGISYSLYITILLAVIALAFSFGNKPNF